MRCVLPHRHVRYSLHVQRMRCMLPRRHVRQPGGRFQARVRGLQRLLQPGDPLPGRLDGGLSCRRSQLPDRLRAHTFARAPSALRRPPARLRARLRADVITCYLTRTPSRFTHLDKVDTVCRPL